ncbi:MAG: ANTAR domain-containing response regulator, partial [Geodermatophilaceae bacterium]
AAREQVVVRVDELATDQRWPTLAERAIPVGVASMLCVPLCVDQSRLGALSLYSEQPNAFSEPDLQLTGLFATHAALALSEAQRTAQLQDALRNRDLIGQAKGILMERSQVTADEAFRQLSQVSQSANLKLTAVAQHLIDTGELVGNHAT